MAVMPDLYRPSAVPFRGSRPVIFSGRFKGDVICTGSMIQDHFITVPKKEGSDNGLEPGAKFDALGVIKQRIGGGATNVTMSLKKLGYNPMPLSRVADDNMGRMIIKHLKKAGVDLRMLQVQTSKNSWAHRLMARLEAGLEKVENLLEKLSGEKLPGFIRVDNDDLEEDALDRTGESIILNREQGDRTVVTARGVSNKLRTSDINWEIVSHANGLYISNFGSEDPEFLNTLVRKAKELNQNMVIAFNPGKQQLFKGMKGLAPVLSRLDILNLNLEEACLLLGRKEKTAPVDELLRELKQAGPKVVVITDGKNGAYAYDGKTRYHMPAFTVPMKSTLGAGDAFGSTLMAYYLDAPEQLENALYYASAQAASVVTHIGAQGGLLGKAELERWVERLKGELRQSDIQVKQQALSVAA